MTYWILQVQIGSGPGVYTWTVEPGDAVDPEIANLLSGLEFGWSMPEADVSPVQPDPMTASFAFVVPDVAILENIDIGSECAVQIGIDPSSGPGSWIGFFGRITDLQAVPRKAGGMIVSAVAVDFTVDERPIGFTDWPSENVADRFARAWAEAGAGTVPDMPLIPWATLLPLREASPTTLPAYLEEVLPTWLGVDADDNWGRYLLSPRAYGDIEVDGTHLDLTQDFMLDPILNRDTPPFEFGLGDDGYGLLISDPDPTDLILDSCYVHLGVQWTRRKFGSLDALLWTDRDEETRGVEAGGSVLVGEGFRPGVLVGLMQTPLAFAGGIVTPDLGFYLNTESGNRWEIQSFVYELSRDIDDGNVDTLAMIGDPQGWFPGHNRSETTRARCFNRIVGIVGIPAEQNPSGTDFYLGQLRAARVFIDADTRIRIEFSLRRTMPAPNTDEGLTPAGLAASPFSAVRVDQLDPAFSVYDYRLAQEA